MYPALRCHHCTDGICSRAVRDAKIKHNASEATREAIILPFFLCVIGAFYAFAGHIATRAALTSHFVDKAIAAIEGKTPTRLETAQSYWLLSAATLVLASGVTLLFLLDVAAWLFVVSSAGQALYLLHLAPRFFDVVDPPDPAGRRRSTNAFLIYLAATALVVWAKMTDVLRDWDEVSPAILVIAAVIVLAHIGYVCWSIVIAPQAAANRPGSLAAFQANASGWDADADPASSTRIKLMADYGTHPLWALDDHLYGQIDPDALALSPQLTDDLKAWGDAFSKSIDYDDAPRSLWSEEQHKHHRAEGRDLAQRLADERPDKQIVYVELETGYDVEVRPSDTSRG